MKSRLWLACSGLAAGLTLVLAVVTAADKTGSDPTTPKDPPDPPGTSMYMDQLRAIFAAIDLNGDNFLDKDELAKAFRGPDAKPYDYVKPKATDSDKDAPKDPQKDPPADPAKTKKPDYSQYPDYNFLTQLDQDGDGQISRSEFLSWARDYAVQLKTQADAQAKVLAAEAKLLTATPGSKEYKKLEAELKHEQTAMNKLNNQAKAEMKAFEKVMQQHTKKK